MPTKKKITDLIGLEKINDLPLPYQFASITEFESFLLTGNSVSNNSSNLKIESYNTQNYIPSPHFKPISKIIDLSKIHEKK